MLKLKEIRQIRKLHTMGQSKRAIARITGASRNTITKYINCTDKIPVSRKPGKESPLAPHANLIRETFLKCGGNCELVRQAILEKLGLEVKGRNLRRFCQQWRPEIKKIKEKEFKRLRAKYHFHRPTKTSTVPA